MRIPEVILKHKVDFGLQDFMDYTMFILNDGLYQFRVLDAIPNWEANDGEAVLYSSGTTRALYFYINGQWVNITWSGGGSAPIALALVDYDEDTLVEVEQHSDEDIIRFSTGNTQGGASGERATITNDGFALETGLGIIFDGRGGDTKFKYNSTSNYLEGWVDGSLRIEL